MGNCFSCLEDNTQPHLEQEQGGKHEQEGKPADEKHEEVKENGKSASPAAPGTPALREEPKKAEDGEDANPEGVKPKVMSEEEEEKQAEEKRQEKKDKDTVRNVEEDVDYATRQALYEHMPSTGDYGADAAIFGAVRSATTGAASMGATGAVNAKSGRQQGVDGKEVGKNTGIAASRTVGDTAGGVAGDQAREHMPETGNAYVDYALQGGADKGLRTLGGLMGEKGAQASAEAAESKEEWERLKKEEPEE